MKHEKSCGTIIFDNEKVLLVKQNLGHWSFPKGHVEKNENEFETAIRETKEETGLDVEIINDEKFRTKYSPEEGIMKDVIFFIAKVDGGAVQRQVEEIAEVKWVPIKEAKDIITFDTDKEILEKSYKCYLKMKK